MARRHLDQEEREVQALGSYSSETRSAVERALSTLHDESLGFSATPCFSQRGLFARFVWPDWPENLKKEVAERIGGFQGEHRELRPVSEGTPDWQAVFGDWRTDRESASVIAEAFCKYFPGRVAWVESERDSRGRIGARCMVKALLEVPPVPSDSPMSRIISEKFGKLSAKPRIVDPKFHRYLIEGFKFRWTADYEALPRDPITQEKARMVLDWAREFVTMADELLKVSGGKLESG